MEDEHGASGPLTLRTPAIRAWLAAAHPAGPTAVQRLAWPRVAAGEHVLALAPTGTGKTLAAFLAILDRLAADHAAGTLAPDRLRCVYVSPLRSLGYDIERNLDAPLAGLRAILGPDGAPPIRVGVRTGDTSARLRRAHRDRSPHILITTPESLALLLGQPAWNEAWTTVDHLVIDEVHALAPNKRGADLAASLERLCARAARDPQRIGLSATCRPAESVARYLVGPARTCSIVEAEDDAGGALDLRVESLLQPGEEPHRGLTYRRLLRRLRAAAKSERTTVVFANTRAFTEKITHDLRSQWPVAGGQWPEGDAPRGASPRSSDTGHRTSDTGHCDEVAAHHSALDADRRREVEAALKAGALRVVVTSTSLELGVDIGTADLAVLVGLPGGAARCLQRVGRAGHSRGATRRGLLLAATPAEVAGAAVTADAARAGRIEPVAVVANPLDVLCQQLIGLACAGECEADEAFALVRKAAPFAHLERADFDACLGFLAGELAAPAGAAETDQAPGMRLTAPRIWKHQGRFGVRSRRVMRWLWSNIGTITSEESMRVRAGAVDLGTLEAAYAERLAPGDRFVLDGRCLEVKSRAGGVVSVAPAAGEPNLPRWTSDRQSLSAPLAAELAALREEAGRRLVADGADALARWLAERYALPADAARVVSELVEAQQVISEVPPAGGVLVEAAPADDGLLYAFHAPLGRAACEALGRAVAARVGRRVGRDLGLAVADLGWSLRVPDDRPIDPGELPAMFAPDDFESDVLAGLDRGELVARRFRHVASTALMVLRNPEGGRTRVGGTHWVSQRLFPLVRATCSDHPLIREAKREVLADVLDAPTARRFLETNPPVRFRPLNGVSPFAAAWIDPAGAEPIRFEAPIDALKRLHARLHTGKG